MSNTSALNYYLFDFWHEFGDRRVKHMPMFTGGPLPVLIIIGVYLLTVLKVIPYLMKKRDAFQLRSTIMCYNISLVFINGFYFSYQLKALNFGKNLLDLNIPSDEEVTPHTQNVMYLYYFYLITKFIDFMDTVFFALRKKSTQITFLHLYHHSLMACLPWLAYWYRFNMQPNKLFILCNSFVHTLMYSYYTLAAFGPKVQKLLWWKPYLTQLQLAQFIIYMLYGLVTEILGLPYPKLLKYFTQIQSPIFFYLFFDFYTKSYKKSQKKII